MDPREIFPAEVWEEIFARIKEATDWLNLYQASSSSFQSVVGTNRVQVLFPQVLPLLRKYLIQGDDKGPLKLLTLRLVSRKWREGVDTLIEKNQERGGVELSNRLYCYFYDTPQRTSAFLEKFANHPTNPIIGSTVQLMCDTLHQDQHSLLIMRLMRQFGAHVKVLDILDYVLRNKTDIGLFVGQVREILELTPALEMLKIECRSKTHVTRVTVQAGSPPPPPPPAALLPNLKSLVIRGNRRTMEVQDRQAFQDAMLRLISGSGNSPLSQACLESGPSELTVLPNLKTLSLIGSTREGLSRLRNLRCPTLSELGLGWYFPEDNDNNIRMMEHVFPVVSHFAETLTSLSIHVFYPIPENVCKEPLLTLPRLKSLRIVGAGSTSFSSLDFLVNLSGLEDLHLEGWIERQYETRNREVGRKIKIPVGDLSIDMLESNIWELLPRLREFSFSGAFLRCPTSNLEGFQQEYSRGRRGQLHFKNLLAP